MLTLNMHRHITFTAAVNHMSPLSSKHYFSSNQYDYSSHITNSSLLWISHFHTQMSLSLTDLHPLPPANPFPTTMLLSLKMSKGSVLVALVHRGIIKIGFGFLKNWCAPAKNLQWSTMVYRGKMADLP